MITVWNTKVVCDKFSVFGTFTNEKRTQKLIVELFNHEFTVLRASLCLTLSNLFHFQTFPTQLQIILHKNLKKEKEDIMYLKIKKITPVTCRSQT
jgi:hypothetical protein